MNGKGSKEAQGDERRKRLLQIGSAAVFLAIVVVAVLIVIDASQTSGGDTELEGVAAVKRELEGIPFYRLTLGKERAPVTMFEYGDLQCPVCKGFSEEVLPGVIESRVRSGEVKIRFENYAILGRESITAGAAAIAAGLQGRGWSYIELFYRNQGQEGSGYVTDDFLTAIARGVDVLDIAKWNKDRKSEKIIEDVEQSSDEARARGFSGTPSFVIEGPGGPARILEGPASLGEIEERIDSVR